MKRQVGSVEFGEHSKLEASAPAVDSEIPRVQIIWNVKEKKAKKTRKRKMNRQGRI
jgi:hypothetical protein